MTCSRFVTILVLAALSSPASAEPARDSPPLLRLLTVPSPPDAPTSDEPPTDEPVRGRRWKPLVAELSAIFAIGQVWYFRNGADGNADDWDMPLSLDSLGSKLNGSGWRFDDNGFVTNSVKHAIIFGAPMHTLARLHGYSFLESFAISTGMSFLWEVGGEIREYGSLNDLLSTSTGGLPIGEALYQIIEHPRQTRFELRAGIQSLDSAVYQHIGARAELDTLTAPGRFVGGKQVRISIDRPSDSEGTRAWELEARSTLAGKLYDSGLLVAAFGAFDYTHKMARMDRSGYDTFANTIVGPTVAYALERDGLRIRGSADLGADFGMLKPQAFEAWRTGHPDEVTRGALEDNKHRYYHAFGTTFEPRLDVSYRGLTLGGRVRASYFNSIEGRDRWSDRATTEIQLEDTRVRATAWLRYEIRRAAVTVEAERESRWGKVDEVTSSLAQRRLTASLGLRF